MEERQPSRLTTLSAALLLATGSTVGVAGSAAWVAIADRPPPPGPVRHAWVEGKIAPVGEAFGIPEDELRFLDEFDHPILDGLPTERVQLRARLRAIFDIGWSRTGDLVRARFPELDERSAMMMFAVLRVNGSLPVYEATRGAPRDLHGLLMARRGNCTEATWRILMWLDTLGLPGRVMQLWTPSMPGHVVADVYDASTGRAYMLDANLNALAWLPSDGRGFFDVLFAMRPEERRARFAEGSPHLVTAPWFMRWYDPGITVDRPGQLSVDDMNRFNYATRLARWRATLTDETDEIVARWKRAWPGGQPRTLDQYDNPAIAEFGIENVLPQEPLLAATGIDLPRWAMRERIGHVGPLRLAPLPAEAGVVNGGSAARPS